MCSEKFQSQCKEQTITTKLLEHSSNIKGLILNIKNKK